MEITKLDKDTLQVVNTSTISREFLEQQKSNLEQTLAAQQAKLAELNTMLETLK